MSMNHIKDVITLVVIVLDHAQILLNLNQNKKSHHKPTKNDNNSFQYGITTALNNSRVGKIPSRIARTKLFINQGDWKEMNLSAEVNN